MIAGLFTGWSRKSVLPSLLLFSVGWVVYMVGFFLLLLDDHGEDNNNYDRIPHFLVVTSGPFLVLSAILHAALSGPLSACCGLIASLLSVACFTGYGHIIYESAIPIYINLLRGEGVNDMDVHLVMMFIGSLIGSFSWMLVIMAWNCFNDDWRMIKSNEYVVAEEQIITNYSHFSRRYIKIVFAGVARKLAAIVLVCLAASWCVFVTGLTEEIQSNLTSHAGESDEVNLQFSVWMVSVVGFLVILAAAGHAGAHGGASLAMGICSSLLGMLFLTSVGYTTHRLGMAIYNKCQGGENCHIFTTSIPDYAIIQLTGAVGMCFTWGCTLALWPFYVYVKDRVQRHQESFRQAPLGQEISLDETLPLLHHENSTAHRGERPCIPTRPSSSVL